MAQNGGGTTGASTDLGKISTLLPSDVQTGVTQAISSDNSLSGISVRIDTVISSSSDSTIPGGLDISHLVTIGSTAGNPSDATLSTICNYIANSVGNLLTKKYQPTCILTQIVSGGSAKRSVMQATTNSYLNQITLTPSNTNNNNNTPSQPSTAFPLWAIVVVVVVVALVLVAVIVAVIVASTRRNTDSI